MSRIPRRANSSVNKLLSVPTPAIPLPSAQTTIRNHDNVANSNNNNSTGSTNKEDNRNIIDSSFEKYFQQQPSSSSPSTITDTTHDYENNNDTFDDTRGIDGIDREGEQNEEEDDDESPLSSNTLIRRGQNQPMFQRPARQYVEDDNQQDEDEDEAQALSVNRAMLFNSRSSKATSAASTTNSSSHNNNAAANIAPSSLMSSSSSIDLEPRTLPQPQPHPARFSQARLAKYTPSLPSPSVPPSATSSASPPPMHVTHTTTSTKTSTIVSFAETKDEFFFEKQHSANQHHNHNKIVHDINKLDYGHSNISVNDSLNRSVQITRIEDIPPELQRALTIRLREELAATIKKEIEKIKVEGQRKLDDIRTEFQQRDAQKEAEIREKLKKEYELKLEEEKRKETERLEEQFRREAENIRRDCDEQRVRAVLDTERRLKQEYEKEIKLLKNDIENDRQKAFMELEMKIRQEMAQLYETKLQSVGYQSPQSVQYTEAKEAVSNVVVGRTEAALLRNSTAQNTGIAVKETVEAASETEYHNQTDGGDAGEVEVFDPKETNVLNEEEQQEEVKDSNEKASLPEEQIHQETRPQAQPPQQDPLRQQQQPERQEKPQAFWFDLSKDDMTVLSREVKRETSPWGRRLIFNGSPSIQHHLQRQSAASLNESTSMDTSTVLSLDSKMIAEKLIADAKEGIFPSFNVPTTPRTAKSIAHVPAQQQLQQHKLEGLQNAHHNNNNYRGATQQDHIQHPNEVENEYYHDVPPSEPQANGGYHSMDENYGGEEGFEINNDQHYELQGRYYEHQQQRQQQQQSKNKKGQALYIEVPVGNSNNNNNEISSAERRSTTNTDQKQHKRVSSAGSASSVSSSKVNNDRISPNNQSQAEKRLSKYELMLRRMDYKPFANKEKTPKNQSSAVATSSNASSNRKFTKAHSASVIGTVGKASKKPTTTGTSSSVYISPPTSTTSIGSVGNNPHKQLQKMKSFSSSVSVSAASSDGLSPTTSASGGSSDSEASTNTLTPERENAITEWLHNEKRFEEHFASAQKRIQRFIFTHATTDSELPFTGAGGKGVGVGMVGNLLTNSGERVNNLLTWVYNIWENLQMSFKYRNDFLNIKLRSISDFTDALQYHYRQQPQINFDEIAAEVEQVLTGEVNRLSKLLTIMSKEVSLINRREAIKARLRAIEQELDPSQVLTGKHKRLASEKLFLSNEFKQISKQIVPALIKWEKTYRQDFMYRGLRYLDVMEHDRSLSERAINNAMKNDIQKWVKRYQLV